MSDQHAPDDGRSSGRRNYLKLIGATGAGLVGLSGSATALTGGLNDVLVTFEAGDSVDLLGDLDLVEGYHAFDVLPVGYTVLTDDQLTDVLGWDEVLSVRPNETLELEHDDARPDTGADDVHDGMDLDMPYTGERVHAAVIDTGVDALHADLADAIAANWQWVGSPLDGEDPTMWTDLGPVTSDDLGHGTHCIGSITADGTQSEGQFRGMAPDATVTSYSVNASASVLKAVSAYDHLMSLQDSGEHKIHIVSNSYGGGAGAFDPYDPQAVAMWQAYERDILSTNSAGNDGPDNDTLGARKQAPYVLTVAACNADQSVADFSSRGDVEGNFDREPAFTNTVDLYAGVPEGDIDGPMALHRPSLGAKGASVMSTLNPAHPLQSSEVDLELWYGRMSGTSMSNPVAAGCAALVIDAYLAQHGTVPDPIDVINTLEATADPDALADVAEPAGATYTTTNMGPGYVDALAAASRAEAGDLAGFDEVDLVGQ